MTYSALAGAAGLTVIAVALGRAQAPPRDTLRLADLQAAAAQGDPRQREFELQRTATALRLRSLDAERLPTLAADGVGQYQSDVTAIPIRLPNVSVPSPPHDTYDARVSVQERLFDATIGTRRDVERAQLAESEARLRATLYALRGEVNDAFFTAALMQARAGELTAVIADLEAQLRVARARVREGTALPSEAATLEAELLRRRQDESEVSATRRASLAVLAALTGRAITERDTLILPQFGTTAEIPRDSIPHARPEYEQFARTRARLAQQERLITAGLQPQLSAFVRAGYGKPGLNFLSDRFESYWLGGLQVHWAPWSWGTSQRDRQLLEVQREIVSRDEEAFTAATRRATQRLLADIDRLQVVLRTDDEIIALRERIERETRRRFDEAVITAAEYVDRRNDVFAARLARAGHEVELAQARTRYLTTIGVELP